MDGDPLDDDGAPLRLELLTCDVQPTGLVRSRYRVINAAGPKAAREPGGQ